jgi:uncharacterized membrane protein YfcA
MNEFLFYAVILISNIFQGITGFAGTILAMPVSLFLVGYAVAKPVLNVLGFLSGIYVFAGSRQALDRSVLKRILLIMGSGVAAGILLKSFMDINGRILYLGLGIFITVIALSGLFLKKDHSLKGSGQDSAADTLLLLTAGVVHGIFVCGGPLLITYLTKKLPEKDCFRATISTAWIVLNGAIMVTDLLAGAFPVSTLIVLCGSIPFLLAGMYIGSVLYKKMNQALFMKLTYVLLLLSGISLLAK